MKPTMDPHCKGCVYLGYAGGGYMCCDYIFKTEHRRPCPPGKDCTVKTTVRQARKKKAQVRGTLRRCAWCDGEFVLKNNGSQKFCCRDCKNAAYREQCRKRREQAAAERGCGEK